MFCGLVQKLPLHHGEHRLWAVFGPLGIQFCQHFRHVSPRNIVAACPTSHLGKKPIKPWRPKKKAAIGEQNEGE
jgi:hypothetical protein